MSVRGVPSSNPQSQSVLAVTLLVYQATALVIFNYCFVDIMVYTWWGIQSNLVMMNLSRVKPHKNKPSGIETWLLLLNSSKFLYIRWSLEYTIRIQLFYIPLGDISICYLQAYLFQHGLHCNQSPIRLCGSHYLHVFKLHK